MDPPSLKNLADAAGHANQAEPARQEADAGAPAEGSSERKPSRRKRSMRPTAARDSESPEVGSQGRRSLALCPKPAKRRADCRLRSTPQHV
jgi:hypothetical protein